jgi:myosin heavy subunit
VGLGFADWRFLCCSGDLFVVVVVFCDMCSPFSFAIQQMAVLRSLVWVTVLVLSLGTMITAEEGGVPSLQDLENKHLLVKEILELRSQVTDLKIVVKDQDSSLKIKDKNIQVLETKFQEFQNQTKGWGDAESKLAAALTKISALEAETAGLKATSERLKVEQEELKRLAEKAELTAAVQLSEKEKATKEVAALKSRLQKAEKALQVAESAVLKLRTEMTAKAKDLAKSTNAWLPPWAAIQASKLQDMVSSRWVAHGEPAVRKVQQTLQAKASQAQKFTKPYWRSTRRFFKKKVYPVIRPGWKRLNHAMVPYLNSIQKLGTQFLDASKRKLSPFLSKMQQIIDPYMKIMREKSQPFVDQAAGFLAPYFQKVKAMAGPYLKQVTSYHKQLQKTVKATMKGNEFLASFASKEVIWFVASMLLALPTIGILLLFSSMFGPKKRTKRRGGSKSSSNSNHRSSGSSQKKSRRPKQSEGKSAANPKLVSD